MDDFAVDTFETAISGDLVRLSFMKDDGQERTVVVTRSQLPLLLLKLRERISPADALPIDGRSLRPGAQISVRGFHVDGEAGHPLTLVLLAELPGQDRRVTVPLPLEPMAARDLAKMLKDRLPLGLRHTV